MFSLIEKFGPWLLIGTKIYGLRSQQQQQQQQQQRHHHHKQQQQQQEEQRQQYLFCLGICHRLNDETGKCDLILS